MLRPMQLSYSKRLELLANDPRFHSEDFTVVWQPQMQDLLPPIDVSQQYFTSLVIYNAVNNN